MKIMVEFGCSTDVDSRRGAGYRDEILRLLCEVLGSCPVVE